MADVFQNFRNMCLKIHQLDPAKFPSASRLAWQAALKNRSKVKIVKWHWYVTNGWKMN